MKVDLHYGDGFLGLNIPQANIARIIRPWQNTQAGDNETLIRQALAESNAKEFKHAVSTKRLCVLVGDGSRDMPLPDIFGSLLELFGECSHVRFMICTGTHDPETPENKSICQTIRTAASAAGLASFDIHVHNCLRDELTRATTTSRGTEVLFNARLNDMDAFCVLSDVKFHYFAGYSNPIKNFLPGLCSFRTAEGNHSFALDDRSTYGFHPWQGDEARRDNPLAADQLEGMRSIVRDRPVFALVTISTSGNIQWARFGQVEEVTRLAFAASDERNTHTVTPTERLIVSPGGLPNDVDLYISQRALELTKQAVVDAGEVLFVSACVKGIGDEGTIENFYDRLTQPINDILQSGSDEYKLFSHKPYKFAQMIRRLRRIWVYSEIADELITAAHLYPTHDAQAVVDAWLAENPNTQITIVDGANKIALYA